MRHFFIVVFFLFDCGLFASPAPLADAVEAKAAERITKLLAGKLNVNIPQVDGMTALHWAAYHDDAALGSRLLKRDARANVKNRYGITPLYLACQNGNGELTQALLKAGACAAQCALMACIDHHR